MNWNAKGGHGLLCSTIQAVERCVCVCIKPLKHGRKLRKKPPGAACLRPDLERLKIFKVKIHIIFVLNIFRHLLKHKAWQKPTSRENYCTRFSTQISSNHDWPPMKPSHIHRVWDALSNAKVMNACSFTFISPIHLDGVVDSHLS
jgi:hypothetical protein